MFSIFMFASVSFPAKSFITTISSVLASYSLYIIFLSSPSIQPSGICISSFAIIVTMTFSSVGSVVLYFISSSGGVVSTIIFAVNFVPSAFPPCICILASVTSSVFTIILVPSSLKLQFVNIYSSSVYILLLLSFAAFIICGNSISCIPFFAIVFWIVQSVVLTPPTLVDVLKGITFQRDTNMLGMLWVIWVYIVCALLIPIISRLECYTVSRVDKYPKM